MLKTRTVWTPELIAQREARRANIEAHIDAGTCHICGKPVVNGAAIHGPTGAHWDCHGGPVAPVSTVPHKVSPRQFDIHPRMARANGGSLVHFVIQVTGTSLCGHKPKDTARHMQQRGKWLVWKDDATVPAHMKQCQKCLAKAQVLYPAIEDESA
ncbi:hypothetical protein [Pseudomonas sp. MWU12-2323]|uniref:hypothetical protein n=1 Tax=Pseudomonas sp. MWU12-2323 TaxID=2651296 RepID=UPI00128BAD1B|nr:hypothetical protein [Pseudomonas sp. MWU12-2323]MPQ69227.1 hypothetical protein [Pseudomonas sp. MWU12-2323]